MSDDNADTATTTQEEPQLESAKPGEEEPVEVVEQATSDASDDEFGAFSDASFDEFKPSTNISPQSNGLSLTPDVFKDPQTLSVKLSELLETVYPGTPSDDATYADSKGVLNDRSQQLLERLTAQPYLKSQNWAKSSLRKKLLVTLGIPDVVDYTYRGNPREDAFSDYEVVPFEELHLSTEDVEEIEATSDDIFEKYALDLKNDEFITSLDEEGVEKLLNDYNIKISNIVKYLSYWENEKTKLEKDNETFESVVENLVGFTQRLRREEIKKNLKKEDHKSKRYAFLLKPKFK